MIFHENRLLADDSHEISHLIFVGNWERCRKICSVAVVIGALKLTLHISPSKIVLWVLKITVLKRQFF